MDSFELRKIGQKFKSFKGVFARDNLPRVKHYPSSYVINTAKANSKGEHWVAAYFSSHLCVDYWDSYGLPPLEEGILHWLLKNAERVKYSRTLLQNVSRDSNSCGAYAIAFCIMRHQGYELEDIISWFTKDLKSNDEIANTLTRIFNSKEYKSKAIKIKPKRKSIKGNGS